jgi:hypothetical protein
VIIIIIIIIITNLQRHALPRDRGVVSFMLRPLFYLREKSPQYLLGRRWDDGSRAGLYTAVANGTIRTPLSLSVIVPTELSEISKYLIIIIIIITA